MALDRGPNFYPYSNAAATDTPPAGVYDLRAVGTGANSSVTVTGTTSATTPTATLFQLFPNGTTALGSTSGVASTALANNKGWQIPPTASMGGTATVPRVIPAGSTITFGTFVKAVGLTGTATLTMSLYKRASGGGLTFIQALTGTQAAGAANAGAGVNFTGSAVASDVVFVAGETLYIELYCSVPGETLTACTVQVNVDSGSPLTVNNPNGVTYRTLSSFAIVGAGAFARMVRTAAKPFLITGAGNSSMGPRLLALLKSSGGAGVLSMRRALTPTPKAVTGTGTATLGPRSLSRALSFLGTGTFMDSEKVVLTAKVAVGVGVASTARMVTAARAFAVTATGAIGYARSVISARSFQTTGSGLPSAVIGLSQAALNRLGGGAVTVVKRITYIFDD